MNRVVNMIGRLRTFKTEFRHGGSEIGDFGRNEELSVIDGANVVSSMHSGVDKHAVLLDLDVPAHLIPSSTPGHSHLYVDVACDWEDYRDLLGSLVKCGVIEEGYAVASIARGASFLRLPWIKKGDNQ